MSGNNKVLVIVGPTASGKTALSLLLAKKFNGEIISADSRQIYRGMDIGTAKAVPSVKRKAQNEKPEEEHRVEGIRHWLVDIKDPDENYSLADFKRDATATVFDIARRKKLPILVGGTAQYIYALVDNWTIPSVREDKQLRTQLKKAITEQGLEKVYKRLLELDPEAAYVVDPKNPRRVIRALEVVLTTGQPFTAQRRSGPPLFDCLLIGISPSPELLKKRISKRVKAMRQAGLVEEVKNLLKKYGRQQKVFDTIGYREVSEYLDGKITLAQAEQKIIANTRHFARRQMQWFKRDKRIHWIAGLKTAEKAVNS